MDHGHWRKSLKKSLKENADRSLGASYVCWEHSFGNYAGSTDILGTAISRHGSVWLLSRSCLRCRTGNC